MESYTKSLARALLQFLGGLLACVVILIGREACAYPVTVTFVDGAGRPAPSIKVRGSFGINGLPILTSDAQGKWTFDTNDVTSPEAVIVFSGAETGVQLEPAEIKISEILALGLRSRTIRATQSNTPSTIVSWTYYSSYTSRLAGLPVAIINPYSYSCNFRKTDTNGYVAWSVPRPTGSCNDSSPSTASYHIVPAEDSQLRCSAFSTSRISGARSCPFTGDDETGFSTASCAVVSSPAPTLASTIKVSVTAAGTTYGIPGVEIVGNANVMAVPGRQTNSLGDFAFTIGSVPGAQATTAFDIVPVRAGYEFFPRSRNSRECAFVGSNTYQCKFSGVRTNTGQGAILYDVAQATTPLSGVSINPPPELGCIPPGMKTTDGFGRAVLPVRTRTQCAAAGSGLWNAPVVAYPSMSGKGFISPTNFQFCPTALITQASVSAYDSNSGVQNYSISGRILTIAGDGFAGANVYVNDALWGQTDASGAFRIGQVVQGATVKLSAQAADFKFDPEFETFVEVGSDVQTLIQARAPDPFAGGIDPPTQTCPVQPDYEIKGLVLDVAGRPQSGVGLFLNDSDQAIAQTDVSGRYSFRVPFQSDAWITVKNGSAHYGPMARSLNKIECDELDVDFQQVGFESVVVSGTVVDSEGLPLEGVNLGVRVDGVPLSYEVISSSDGNFRFTAPQGAGVVVSPLDSRFVFSPSSDAIEIASSDETLAAFKGARVVVPTPIPSVAPTVPAPQPTLPAPNPATPVPTAPAPLPSATPLPTSPTAPIPTAAPVPTSPTQPSPTPTTPSKGGPNPQPAPPALTAVPTQPPFNPPPSNSPLPVTPTPPANGAPPVIATPIATPPGMPTTPGGPAPTPPAAPVEPSPVPPPIMPAPTAVPTSTPLPPEIFPTIRVRALCDSSSQSGMVDWFVANDGIVELNGGWEGLDITQPNLIVESGPLSRGAESGGVLRTSLAGVPVDFYRLHVFVFNRLGERVTLALERWDSASCLRAPTPTPVATVPSEQPPVGVTPPPTGGEPPAPAPVFPPPGDGGPNPPPEVAPPPVPTAIPTPTPTPIPTYAISGIIRDGTANSKGLSTATAKALVNLGAAVEVRGMSGTDFLATVPFSQLEKSGYALSAPAGRYRIKVTARKPNSLRIKSVFRKNATEYTCVLPGTTGRCRNISFAVAPRSLLKGGGS